MPNFFNHYTMIAAMTPSAGIKLPPVKESDNYEYTLAELVANQSNDLAFPVTVDAQSPFGTVLHPSR